MYYLGTVFAILFFGGFMVKSYWDEHIFERDTRRLLAYYKHAIPGSMLDGNLQVSTREINYEWIRSAELSCILLSYPIMYGEHN